jgi:hypothetical protein
LISIFIAFLWTMLGNSIVRIFDLPITNDLIESTLENPAIIYYAIHLILSLIYFPIALLSFYKINLIKLLILDLVPAIWLTLFLLPSISGHSYSILYCEQCAIDKYLRFMSTDPDPIGKIELYRREMIREILLRTGLGLSISAAFIFAVILAKKRVTK